MYLRISLSLWGIHRMYRSAVSKVSCCNMFCFTFLVYKEGYNHVYVTFYRFVLKTIFLRWLICLKSIYMPWDDVRSLQDAKRTVRGFMLISLSLLCGLSLIFHLHDSDQIWSVSAIMRFILGGDPARIETSVSLILSYTYLQRGFFAITMQFKINW